MARGLRRCVRRSGLQLHSISISISISRPSPCPLTAHSEQLATRSTKRAVQSKMSMLPTPQIRESSLPSWKNGWITPYMQSPTLPSAVQIQR